MRSTTLSKLVGLAAVLLVGGFVTMGFTRLAVGYDLARTVAAPLFLAGFAVAVGLFVVGVLWKLGIVEIED
ncbi:hypothetical protein SAMN06269185_0528 [Natronoarchaeum philippinense]|uniref:Uncharacterized protein n=1 Tax=Natronoarchaeum philippinense TaxID=558529 RepID=A0A285N4I5_NATPI|nr:hypothetical protein [Natronoarchaeum philippinense]SNZ04340.1 hypothetical protein SAMN06269185_0528 [Natronoarchaeum philippinense]